MRENEVMEQLAALGTEQTRKTYGRHGVTGAMLGVLYSDLRKLQKRYGTDQALAESLWATGIHDARVLATMIADPAAMAEPGPAPSAKPDARAESATESRPEPKIARVTRMPRIGTWGAEVDNRPLLDGVAELAAKTPIAVDTLNTWIAAGDEWLAAMGWQVLAILASRGNGAIDDATHGRYLQQIERTIHGSPNWVRYTMNGALIAIGLRSQALQAEALAAAQRIGKVVVDHGQTACKTPDAISYMRRAVLRRSENTNDKQQIPASEEPQMTDNTTQSPITKRNSTESAPKTSTKRAAGGQTAAKKASKKAAKKAGAKKAAPKKAAKKAGAKKAAPKKVAKKAAPKKAAPKKAAKKAGARPAKKAAKKAAPKKAAARPAKKAAKKTAAKKVGKRAAANGAAPKKATKRASKGTSRKQPAPTTAPPPANP